MRTIHARTIAALTASQRLLARDPLTRDYYPPIEIKKIMAHIRITEEAMQDASRGPFIDAVRKEFQSIRQHLHFDPTTDSWIKP